MPRFELIQVEDLNKSCHPGLKAGVTMGEYGLQPRGQTSIKTLISFVIPTQAGMTRFAERVLTLAPGGTQDHRLSAPELPQSVERDHAVDERFGVTRIERTAHRQRGGDRILDHEPCSGIAIDPLHG